MLTGEEGVSVATQCSTVGWTWTSGFCCYGNIRWFYNYPSCTDGLRCHALPAGSQTHLTFSCASLNQWFFQIPWLLKKLFKNNFFFYIQLLFFDSSSFEVLDSVTNQWIISIMMLSNIHISLNQKHFWFDVDESVFEPINGTVGLHKKIFPVRFWSFAFRW